jgi:hypothetical protein
MNTYPLHLTRHAEQRCMKRSITQEALRAATLYGDRFVQDDGCVLLLVTQRAAARLVHALGLAPGYVDSTLRGAYVVMRRSGAVVTCGRRWAGAAGRVRRS